MYAKIFLSIFDGTLATVGPWEALVTFENALILADRDGILDMTPEALARRTTIPLEIIIKGLEALERPDPQSRTPDEEGRRIIRLSDSRPWGWRIVNYAHYREIRSADDRRAYMKNYQRKYRLAEFSTVLTVSARRSRTCAKPWFRHVSSPHRLSGHGRGCGRTRYNNFEPSPKS